MFRAIEAPDFDAVAGKMAPDCDFRAPGVALHGPDGAWS